MMSFRSTCWYMASKWVMPQLTLRKSMAVLMLVPPPRLHPLPPQCALVLHHLLALSRPLCRLVLEFVCPLRISISTKMGSMPLHSAGLVPMLLLQSPQVSLTLSSQRFSLLLKRRSCLLLLITPFSPSCSVQLGTLILTLSYSRSSKPRSALKLPSGGSYGC